MARKLKSLNILDMSVDKIRSRVNNRIRKNDIVFTYSTNHFNLVTEVSFNKKNVPTIKETLCMDIRNCQTSSLKK